MMLLKKLAESNWGYIYCASSSILSCLLGLLFPGYWLLPIFNALLIYPIYAVHIYQGELKRAFYQMMLWTIFISLTTIILTILFPEKMAEQIYYGVSYRDKMFNWIQTGINAESDMKQFIPIYLGYFILFCILTILSGGFIGLLFGAILLNYMNFYVGELIRESGYAWQAILFSWPIWAITRVIGFILIAIVLSHLFYVYLYKRDINRALSREYIIAGLSLILLDILLKSSLAVDWQKLLEPVLIGLK